MDCWYRRRTTNIFCIGQTQSEIQFTQWLLQHKSVCWKENSIHMKFHSSDLKSRTCIWSIWKNRTNLVSWVIEHPKFLPATQCHVPPKSSSHFFFIKVATSCVKIGRQIRRRRNKGPVHCQIMITFSTWCLSRASLTRKKTFSDRSAGMSALNILICRSRQNLRNLYHLIFLCCC